MRRAVKLTAIGVLVIGMAFVVVTDVSASLLRGRMFTYYTNRLNAWVAEGGPPDKMQTQVADTCGMLVLSEAGAYERIQLMTFYRKELDFREDVCVSITANRVYKQPEFKKPEMVDMICDDNRPFHELFPKLCRLSGLRP